jgi:hypothetical protein
MMLWLVWLLGAALSAALLLGSSLRAARWRRDPLASTRTPRPPGAARDIDVFLSYKSENVREVRQVAEARRRIVDASFGCCFGCWAPLPIESSRSSCLMNPAPTVCDPSSPRADT